MKKPRTNNKLLPILLANVLIIALSLVWIFPAMADNASPRHITDKVIRNDTSWSGDIIIEGVVVVARGATLKILPGTKIRFRKIDRNNDGIGDSEIRVLGRILAEGAPGNLISFDSAEDNPAPKDWSYLLVFTSGSYNKIDFCSFKHGFTGLQVHFSTVSVKNSTFTDNFEGIRFGRADLSIENNRFSHNDVGIRFTRMEGPVLIKGNEVTDNRLGIFLVPSGQNIRDFFEPDRSGRPWNTGHLKITGNNIFNNDTYNLSLGEKQLWNLEISGNYWGSTFDAEIEAKIFDNHRDDSLGKAFYKPYAKEKYLLTVNVDKH